MGISEGLEDREAVDCSVGTIVWVRRRNGSWWPGRILGLDELSASNLMSPRAGTPVKLLGREDASVDWYNLEKSKRIKAFRCREFIDCIERAESSQGIPIRKREKYARREDAILHALELEKEHLENKFQKLGTNKMPEVFEQELGSSAENYGNCNGARADPVYLNLKSKMVSFDDPHHALDVKNLEQVRGQDDYCESVPRMRGLQDFGLRIARQKEKKSSFAHVSYQEPVFGDHTSSYSGRDTDNSLAVKRKRTHGLPGAMVEESLVRKRDRRRPLFKVLQSSAPLYQSSKSCNDPESSSPCKGYECVGTIDYQAKNSSCMHFPSESNSMDSIECPLGHIYSMPPDFKMGNQFPTGSQSDSEERWSSGLIEVRESEMPEGVGVEDNMEQVTSGFSDPSHSGRHNPNFQMLEQPGNVKQELEESLPFVTHEARVNAAMGGSKWQLKGKRNTRSLFKRPMELMDGNSVLALCKYSGSLSGPIYEPKGSAQGTEWAVGQVSLCGSEDYSYDESFLNENEMAQAVGFPRSRCPLTSGSFCSDKSSDRNIIGLPDDSDVMPSLAWPTNHLSPPVLGGYWDGSDVCFHHRYNCGNSNMVASMLVDVNVKVQTNYQGERVPLVSLMSRLNGKAIIGHPVQIEVTEDGFSDILLATNNIRKDLTDADANGGLLSVWRTARRTVMYRMPRPHPASALGEEIAPLPGSNVGMKPSDQKPHASNLDLEVKLERKFSHVYKPLSEKFPKKLKKINLPNQKRKALSSLAVEQHVNGEAGKSTFGATDGDAVASIKPKEAAPLVRYVPVKLIFSRLQEAVRPPSIAAINGVFSVPPD